MTKNFLKKHLKVLVLIAILVAAICFSEIVSWNEIYAAAEVADISQTQGDMTVHFIDIGTGDSALITQGNYNILIDSGDSSIDKKVISYLQKRGVNELDLVVATHQDKDHVGEMASIIDNFNVKDFWMPEVPEELLPETEDFTSMMLALENKGVCVKSPQKGDVFAVGNIHIQVLSPAKEYKEINDYSLVLKLKYRETEFLFTGDAGEKAEEQMLLDFGDELKADVIKAAHHGSRSSNTREFLTAVSPDIAVISTGYNTYNLPSPQVVLRLESMGVETYQTRYSGTVVLISDGFYIEALTEKG